jgi:hypothetical protein
MTQGLEEVLEHHRYQRLVLNDENVTPFTHMAAIAGQ